MKKDFKKNKLKKTQALFLALAIFSSAFAFHSSFAQVVPQNKRQINISAYIINQANQEMVNGDYLVRFAVYSKDRETADPYPSNTDSKVWEETQTVKLHDGFLEAFVGAANPFPKELNFTTDNYYLGIRINTDSEMVPRKRIGATPLAINSFQLEGSEIGTQEGDIPLLGKNGLLDVKMLPVVTDLGTISAGTWEADLIANNYIASALTGKTYNSLTLTSNADGFSIAGGSTSRELTVTGGDVILNAPGTAGSIAYSDGTGYAFSAAGEAGQVLTSNGSGAPTWGAGSGAPENDPIFGAWDRSSGISITESQISDLQAYLTAETDPVFSASSASGITGTNIANWNTAYGWGNHASAGYVTGTPWTGMGYITDGNTNWDNSYGFITDGNTGWDNSYGFITDLSTFTTDNLAPGSTNLYSQWITSGADIYYNTGSVGIGTDDPNSLFQVAGLINFDPTLFNTFLGESAGQANTTGSSNFFGGYQAGYGKTTADNTVFIGYQAGYGVAEDDYSIGIGTGALYTGGGTQNIGIGYHAGYLSDDNAYDNVFIGMESGLNNTDGHGNIFIGTDSGRNNSVGNHNVFIGVEAGKNNNIGYGNIFLGYQAGYYETGSNKLFIDNLSRTNEDTSRVRSLVYGIFDAAAANQQFNINGKLGLLETGSSATYRTFFQSGDLTDADSTYTWPDAYPGVSGYVLSSTDAGVMSWVAKNELMGYATVLDEASPLTQRSSLAFLGDGVSCADNNGQTECTIAGAATHDPVTINATANGLSIDGSQVLTLGLASTSTIGALSDTDWDTFNSKVSSQWVTADSDIYYNTGNIGIGDTSPDYILELYDPTNTPALALSDDDIVHGLTTLAQTDVFSHLASLSTTDGGTQWTNISDTDAQALSIRGVIGSTDPTDTIPAIRLIGAKSNGTTGMADLGALETVFQVANNDDTSALTILGSGNVGIGTNTPGGKLSMTANGGATDLASKMIINSNSSSWGQVQLGGTGSREVSLAYISNVTAYGGPPTSSSGNTFIWNQGVGMYSATGNQYGLANTGYGGLSFLADSNGGFSIGAYAKNWTIPPIDGMIISGNFGLGNVSPVAADSSAKTLQIGNNYILQNVVGTQTLLSNNAYYNGSSWKYANSAAASAIRFKGLNTAGEITFTVSPPGTAGNTITNFDGSDIKMTILPSGSVGIGDTSPLSLLTVGSGDAFQIDSSGQVMAGSWLASAIGAQYGGTGVNGASAGNGTLLIGNGAGYSLASLTAGAGISITNGAGSITIANASDSVTSEPTGFPNVTDTTLSFDNGTRDFTITGTNFKVYSKGMEYIKNTASVNIPNSNGLHFVYYDKTTLNLSTSTSPWSMEDGTVQVATVYWNGSAGIIGNERHGLTMDGMTHNYLHSTVGTRYNAGLAGSFNTPPAFVVSSGSIYDEDLKHTIGDITSCRLFYRDGAGNFNFTAPQSNYYNQDGGGVVTYDDGDGGPAQVGTNDYVASWIFATNDPSNPIMCLMGQRTDTTIANARANNTYENLVLANAPFKEFKLLYRVIVKRSGTNETYQETQDLRSVSNLPSGTYVATAHGALTGLLNDDHTQYALLAGRAGGQTLIGGDGTTDDLILRTTSGTGASGADMIFQTGTNGGTEAMRILYDGKIGIGVASPDAYLQIKAGTDAAGTAPIKFTAGANLTAPEAGALEWDGTNLFITQTAGPTRKTLAYTSDIPAGHTQNTDTGTTQTSFIVGSATDAAANDLTIQFGGSNQETFYFDGDNTDNFKLSDDFDITGGLTTTGNVGIGTIAPSSLLDLQKAGTAKADTNLFEITNSGNASDMDGTLSSILFNQFYYDASTPAVADAGKISVGTETDWTSTASTQDSYLSFSTALNGTVAEKMWLSSGGDVTILAGQYYQFGSDGSAGITGRGNNNGDDYLSFDTDFTQRMFISDSGNVGVGDNSPASLFTVGNGDLFQVNSSGYALHPLGAVGTPSISFVGDPDTGLWSSAANTLNFSTTGAERMSINSTGLVSIPNLEMGAQTFADDAGTVSWIDLPITSASVGTAESYSAQIDSHPILTIYGESDGSGGLQSEAVGIGIENPDYLLDVAGAARFRGNDNAIQIATDGGTTYGYITIQGGGVNGVGIRGDANSGGNAFLVGSSDSGIVVDSAGNVGIGDATPASKLEVSGGDIRVTGGSFIDDGTTLTVPDYVFETDYNLMPLDQLVLFVSANKHLPGVPDMNDRKRWAALSLQDRDMLLLEKTEENALYIIQNHQQLATNSEQLSALNLKTDGNITTLSELQSSVDEQLKIISNFQFSISNQFSIFNDQISNAEKILKQVQDDNIAQADLIAVLQAQIVELQTKLNTETNIAQIDLNTQDAQFIKLLLGTDRVVSPEDVDILGKLSAKTLATGGIEITLLDPEAKTIGENAIPADESIMFVETKAVTADSKIYITPLGSTNNQVIYVGNIDAAKGFEVKVDRIKKTGTDGTETSLFPNEIRFNWWIVQAK